MDVDIVVVNGRDGRSRFDRQRRRRRGRRQTRRSAELRRVVFVNMIVIVIADAELVFVVLGVAVGRVVRLLMLEF